MSVIDELEPVGDEGDFDPCQQCDGRGYMRVDNSVCWRCDGSGEVCCLCKKAPDDCLCQPPDTDETT